jgi:hypothetical protein
MWTVARSPEPETEAVGGRARMQNLIDEMHQGTREE